MKEERKGGKGRRKGKEVEKEDSEGGKRRRGNRKEVRGESRERVSQQLMQKQFSFQGWRP